MSANAFDALLGHHIKARDFYTLHAAGVRGDANPRGHVDVVFHLERFPLPKTHSHRINQDGKLNLS